MKGVRRVTILPSDATQAEAVEDVSMVWAFANPTLASVYGVMMA